MTAKLIRYIRFSLYNCREIAVHTPAGSGKLEEFYFAKFVFCNYPALIMYYAETRTAA